MEISRNKILKIQSWNLTVVFFSSTKQSKFKFPLTDEIREEKRREGAGGGMFHKATSSEQRKRESATQGERKACRGVTERRNHRRGSVKGGILERLAERLVRIQFSFRRYCPQTVFALDRSRLFVLKS